MLVFNFNVFRVVYAALFLFSSIIHVKGYKPNIQGNAEDYSTNTVKEQTDLPLSDDSSQALFSNVTEDEDDPKDQYQKQLQELFTFKEKIEHSQDLIRLRKSLLFGYDKFSRPLKNSSDSIVVKLGVNVAQINGLDEDFQVMVSTLQISLRWNDEFLVWNKSLFHNSIKFRSNEIWVPDAIVKNSINSMIQNGHNTNQKGSLNVGNAMSIFDLNERFKYLIVVKPNGDCRWVFPMKLMSNCQLDQQYFPFDTQKCNIDFGSTAYNDKKVLFKKFKDKVHTELHQQTEFDLLGAKYSYVTRPQYSQSHTIATMETVTIIRIQLLMRRKMVFYLNKIILPYFVFYVVTIFTYLLPVESGEKKSYCTSILISAMMYLKDTNIYIPKTREMPLLSVYFNMNLIFIFLCVISSTIVYLIHFMGKTKRPLPRFLKKMIENRYLTTYTNLCCSGNLLYPEYKEKFNSKLTNSSFNNKLKDLDINRSDYRARLKRIVQEEINIIDDDLKTLEQSLVFKINNNEVVNNIKSSHKSKINYETKVDKQVNESLIDLIGNDILNIFTIIKFSIKRNVEEDALLHKSIIKKRNTLLNFIEKRPSDRDNMGKNLMNNSPKENKQLNNIKYVDTLENLKLKIVKPHKCKQIYISQKSTCCNNDKYEPMSTRDYGKKYLTILKNYNRQLSSYVREKNLKPVVTVFEKNEEKNSVIEPDYSCEWKYLAILIDRLIFIVFSIVIPVCLTFLFVKLSFMEPVVLD